MSAVLIPGIFGGIPCIGGIPSSLQKLTILDPLTAMAAYERVVKVWNSLPPSIVNFSSLATFRNSFNKITREYILNINALSVRVLLVLQFPFYNCHFSFYRIALFCIIVYHAYNYVHCTDFTGI